jgi:dTMP kinase
LDAERMQDKFEQEKNDFFAATRSEYLRRAAQFPARFRLIDSSRPMAVVKDELRAIIGELAAS